MTERDLTNLNLMLADYGVDIDDLLNVADYYAMQGYEGNEGFESVISKVAHCFIGQFLDYLGLERTKANMITVFVNRLLTKMEIRK